MGAALTAELATMGTDSTTWLTAAIVIPVAFKGFRLIKRALAAA